MTYIKLILSILASFFEMRKEKKVERKNKIKEMKDALKKNDTGRIVRSFSRLNRK